MVNKEIVELKELFYKELREMDSSTKIKLSNLSNLIEEKNKEQEEKINLTIQKNEQLYNNIINEKNKLDKIGQIFVTQKKLNDMIMSQELKLKELFQSIQRLNTNYDKIILDNLTVPGFVGSSCVYKNLSEYIQYNIKEMEKIKIEKESVKKIVEEMKHKIDGLMKNILNLLDNSVKRCNIYTDKKQKYIEEFIQHKLVEINEKNMDFRTQIFTNLSNNEQRVDNFEDQIRELKDLKVSIKNDIDNIINDFEEKIGKLENKFSQKIKDKFKSELDKLNNDIKKNAIQSPMRQHKYNRKDIKFATSYSKQIAEKVKGDLNSPNTKTKNISENLKEGGMRKFMKKKTQVIKVKSNFKLIQMMNKVDDDNILSESAYSQELNINNKSNDTNIINSIIKEENTIQKIDEKEKNGLEINDIENNKQIKMNDDNIINNNEDKKPEQTKDEENFILKEYNKARNDFEKIEQILEKENESKSKEIDEIYLNNKKDKEEKKEENENKEKKTIEEEKNFTYNSEEIDEVTNNKINKIKSKYNKENIFGNNLILNSDIKNKEIIKNENKGIDLFLVPKNAQISEATTNDKKNPTIPELINKQKENYLNFESSENKYKRSRNESYQNSKTTQNKKNLNSFNNLKRNLKINNLKTDIEKINSSSKSNSNSVLMDNLSNDKEQDKENDLKQISSEKIIFSKTIPKFYIKEQKHENIQTQTQNQTEKKYNKLSFPKMCCNIKLINLGTNINFIKKQLLLDQSEDKAKDINKNLNIDFSSPLTNIYKAYKKKKKEKKSNNMYNNIYQNNNQIKLSSNEPLKLELKGEKIKFPKFKVNNSISNINNYNNKKDFQNYINLTKIK